MLKSTLQILQFLVTNLNKMWWHMKIINEFFLTISSINLSMCLITIKISWQISWHSWEKQKEESPLPLLLELWLFMTISNLIMKSWKCSNWRYPSKTDTIYLIILNVFILKKAYRWNEFYGEPYVQNLRTCNKSLCYPLSCVLLTLIVIERIINCI